MPHKEQVQQNGQENPTEFPPSYWSKTLCKLWGQELHINKENFPYLLQPFLIARWVDREIESLYKGECLTGAWEFQQSELNRRLKDQDARKELMLEECVSYAPGSMGSQLREKIKSLPEDFSQTIRVDSNMITSLDIWLDGLK